MSIYDLLKEAGFFTAKAGCAIYKEFGIDESTIPMVQRLNEIALELYDIAEGLK